jgi:chromosomal replication initiator protein
MSNRNILPVDYDSLNNILHEVCEILEVSPVLVKSKSKKEDYVLARNIVSYVAKNTTKNSLKTIGSFINRDHTSVINHLIAVKNYLDTNDEKFLKRWNKFCERSQIWKSYKPAA